MGLYRIWLNPRGVGRHAINRDLPAAKPYSVDIEAPSMEAAKKRANSSPLWTGEITTLRSGDSKRAGSGRASRSATASWRHIGSDHYRVTDREALSLARAARKPLPKHGYELSVQLPDGRMAWLKRTPFGIGHTFGSGYATAKDVPKRRWVWAVTPRTSHGNRSRKSYIKTFKVDRVHLDRGGYDHRGRYYGVGAPLFTVTDDDTDRSVTVRARDARHARAEALQRPNHWGGWR